MQIVYYILLMIDLDHLLRISKMFCKSQLNRAETTMCSKNTLKMDRVFVYSSPFNVFCVTETWLSAHVYDKEILPKIFRKDRDSRGWGVLIAVNTLLPSILISSPSNLEVVAVDVCLSS